MDGRTKLLFTVFLLVVAFVSFVCYKKYVVDSDYLIHAEAGCDPYVETCFIYNCNPEINECTGSPDEDTYYYKEVMKSVSQLPNCDPNSEDCFFAQCNDGEVGCNVTLCDPNDSVSTCSSMEDFILESDEEESVGEEAIDEKVGESNVSGETN